MKNNTLPTHFVTVDPAKGTRPSEAALTDLLRAQYLALALESLGQPLIVLGSHGRIMHATPQAANILAENDGLLAANAKLQASVANDDEKLQIALGTRIKNGIHPEKPEIFVQRPSGKLPYKLRINLFAADDSATTKTTHGALIIIHDTHANHAAWHHRLKERFNLTPRECECAVLLTEGLNLPEIAERMDISTQTLRQHLKHAMQKTSTHKQHELAGLVLQMHRKR